MNSITVNLNTNGWLESKYKIYKNLIIISFAWVLLFTAFQSMANLQSSLNNDQDLGTKSLSTIYFTLVLSCILIPPFIIDKYGLKTTIIISQFTYLLYIAANIYPNYKILIPAAALLGLGAGPLWTAKCYYVTELACYYSLLSKETSEIVVNRFFGIFFSMFQFSQIIGNLISSLVLKPVDDSLLSLNKSSIVVFNLDMCGINDCPTEQTIHQTKTKIIPPKLSTVYTLCLIYIILAFLSITLITFLLNDLKVRKKKQENKLDLLISTVKQMKNKNQLLIIPLTLWLGFSLAFIGADFTRSFVACATGVDQVGFAMISFGIANAFGSILFGQIIKYINRIYLYLMAAFINYLAIYLMLEWKINDHNEIYLILFMWGLADSIWQTQVNSLYGVLFNQNQEAAFSNFRLWESLGFFFSYFYSSMFCVSTKLYLLLVYLTLGLIGYLCIEINENNLKKRFSFFVKYKYLNLLIISFILIIFFNKL